MPLDPSHPDSRTASFERKRCLYPSTIDITSYPSSQPTVVPLKRIKMSAVDESALHDAKQSLHEIDSSKPITSDEAKRLASRERPEEPAEHVSIKGTSGDKPSRDQNPSQGNIQTGLDSTKSKLPIPVTIAPSINWNTGTKSVIRTTLGGGGSTSQYVPMSIAADEGRGEKVPTVTAALSAVPEPEIISRDEAKSDPMVISYSQSQPQTVPSKRFPEKSLSSENTAAPQDTADSNPPNPPDCDKDHKVSDEDNDRENHLLTRYFAVHKALSSEEIALNRRWGLNQNPNMSSERGFQMTAHCLVCRGIGHSSARCPELRVSPSGPLLERIRVHAVTSEQQVYSVALV